jgi:hypothetical protein
MNPEYKAKWIAALRSGAYKQGREALRNDDEFCCLGVLCDVIDQNGWENYQDDRVTTIALWKFANDEYETSFGENGPAVQLTGLSAEIQDKLIELNDKDRASFKQIADYIEEVL